MPERPELRKEPGLGPLLKELRGSLGLGHKDVAVAVWGDEAKWNWYSKLENRPNAYPSDTDLDRILAVLGSSRDEAEIKLGRRTWSDPVQRAPVATLAMFAAPAAAQTAAAAPASAPAPAPVAARRSLRSRLPARAAPPDSATADVAPVAGSPPSLSDPQELRREGSRLLTELSGEDLEQGVRQLRSLRARSRRD